MFRNRLLVLGAVLAANSALADNSFYAETIARYEIAGDSIGHQDFPKWAEPESNLLCTVFSETNPDLAVNQWVGRLERVTDGGPIFGKRTRYRVIPPLDAAGVALVGDTDEVFNTAVTSQVSPREISAQLTIPSAISELVAVEVSIRRDKGYLFYKGIERHAVIENPYCNDIPDDYTRCPKRGAITPRSIAGYCYRQ